MEELLDIDSALTIQTKQIVMEDRYFTVTSDFTLDVLDRWAQTPREERIALFGTAAILGTCWGFSKIYFWWERRKTQKRIQEERAKLRKGKEELYRKLKKRQGKRNNLLCARN